MGVDPNPKKGMLLFLSSKNILLTQIGGHKGWGKPGDDEGGPEILDERDPNFVDEEESEDIAPAAEIPANKTEAKQK